MLHDPDDSGDLFPNLENVAVPLHDPFFPLHLAKFRNGDGPHFFFASYSALHNGITTTIRRLEIQTSTAVLIVGDVCLLQFPIVFRLSSSLPSHAIE